MIRMASNLSSINILASSSFSLFSSSLVQLGLVGWVIKGSSETHKLSTITV